MRALQATVRESSFHPKSWEKICISRPPLSVCPHPPHTQHTNTVELGKGEEAVKGPLKQYFQ